MGIPWILTGPIRSGKTTLLESWASQTNGVAGILCPDRGSLRRMHDLATSEEWPLETTFSITERLVSVGRFWFLQDAFDRANHLLLTSVARQPAWIVVDEVGKLELQGKGLFPAVAALLEAQKNHEWSGELILVIRDSLLEAALDYFDIRTWNSWHGLRRHGGATDPG